MSLALAALFSLSQVFGFPMPLGLVSGAHGHAIAYVLQEGQGARSLWYAHAPDYAPKELWHSNGDDGQELSDLAISSDGAYVVYVRGGDHDANWPVRPWPNPDLMPQQARQVVMSVATSGGTPVELGDGDAPAISPDGRTVAFIHDPDPAVWSAPIDGSKKATQLFFDRGADSDIQYSPDGNAIAFVSDRGDHSFIGVYRNQAAPLQFLAPTTNRDFMPRWSPDGTQIAYVRINGAGGAPKEPAIDLLGSIPQPWAIEVARVADGGAHEAWHSGTRSRDSFPGIKGPQLTWGARNTLAFVSEQTNWPNIYAVPAQGGAARDLTPGRFMVEDTALAQDGSSIYYSANTGTAAGDRARRHLYRVDLASGVTTTVSSGTDSQWWPAALDGGVAYVNAGAREPFTIAYNGRKLDSDRIPADFPTQQLVEPTLVSFPSANGFTIDATRFQRPGTTGKHPAIIFVHGGPPRQMMLTWHYFDYYDYGYATNQYLASLGYVVISVNYRLGIGYGHDFQYPADAGPLGASEYRDIVAAAHYLQRDPNVDASKIGIYGGSYGGFLTAMALAKNSDIFKAGVDFHGVHDMSYWANEGYTAEKRYEQPHLQAFLKRAWLSSPDAYVSTWRSPVLLVQGDDDRNVEFHQMVDLVERLKAQHVPYEQLVIPNEIHGFLRRSAWLSGDGATVDFFLRKMPPR